MTQSMEDRDLAVLLGAAGGAPACPPREEEAQSPRLRPSQRGNLPLRSFRLPIKAPNCAWGR